MQASAQSTGPIGAIGSDWLGDELESGAGAYADPFNEALHEIAGQLAGRNDIQVSLTDSALLIMPTGAEGFPIKIAKDGRSVFADFGGCQQNFEALSEVRYCLDRTLSGSCRLRIDYRNGKPHHWTLEDTSRGGARALISCGYMKFSIWPFGVQTTSRHFSYRWQ